MRPSPPDHCRLRDAVFWHASAVSVVFFTALVALNRDVPFLLRLLPRLSHCLSRASIKLKPSPFLATLERLITTHFRRSFSLHHDFYDCPTTLSLCICLWPVDLPHRRLHYPV